MNEARELKKIGEKLKKLRIKKGFSSYERFAVEYGLSRMHYWRIEEGKTNITLRSLITILDIHKVPLEKFFSESTIDD